MFQWNPANLSVWVRHAELGAEFMTGFAPDTFVTVDPADDQWSDRVSADGKVVTRNKINNPMGEVAIVLEAASPSNDFLQNVINLDRQNETGIVSLTVTDTKGLERAAASKAWVRRQPSLPYGASAGTRGWTFRAWDLVIEARGSSQLP